MAGENVGIVFQFFQLLLTLTALEKAVLPLDFARRGSKRERFERALACDGRVMRASAVVRKSIGDLKRRRARTARISAVGAGGL